MASRINIKTILLSAFMFALLFSSCDNSVDSKPNAWDQVNFENVKNGLINYQEDTVRFELNKVFSIMKPVVAADDEFGHKNNFNLFINEFNTRTASMDMELLCYSCIKTFPAQSELSVKINIGGGILTRIINVSTPEDSSLSMIGMHH